MKKTNTSVNAPETKTAILLDAEREDSKFDYRQAEEIFSRSEAEAYEDRGGFFDDEAPVVELGYHKAVLIGWEEVRSKAYCGRDGQRYEAKAYLSLTFMVGNAELKTRAYGKQFNSFKIQMNKAYRGLFDYTPAKEALGKLVGKNVDIWVQYNDVLGELQADYYDKEAYARYRAERNQVDASSIRGGSKNRPTEKKAC